MKFTEDDLKMVRWLRRQHAAWPSLRLIIVSCALVAVGYSVWLIFRDGFDFSAGFFMIVGSYGLSYTLGSWSGRPEISLLLKLLEAQNPESGRDDQA